jgi:hypothetical protein
MQFDPEPIQHVRAYKKVFDADGESGRAVFYRKCRKCRGWRSGRRAAANWLAVRTSIVGN